MIRRAQCHTGQATMISELEHIGVGELYWCLTTKHWYIRRQPGIQHEAFEQLEDPRVEGPSAYIIGPDETKYIFRDDEWWVYDLTDTVPADYGNW